MNTYQNLITEFVLRFGTVETNSNDNFTIRAALEFLGKIQQILSNHLEDEFLQLPAASIQYWEFPEEMFSLSKIGGLILFLT